MKTNQLNHETSPYLLQHADNPVYWNAWKDEVLATAQAENKLLLISIGYSACHWCHVMAHECFEDQASADLMNEGFINIKVDREERPDVDHVYMQALQIMTGRGGWPLNIVALPDGRPVWGATYLPKKHWKGTLRQLRDLYQQDPQKMVDYAEKLSDGIQQLQLFPSASEKNSTPNSKNIATAVAEWQTQLDQNFGGNKGAPKFMMPNNLQFLIRYGHQKKDKNILKYVQNTLDKMAFGGVYDQLQGGFARYAVDSRWHIPHFEKMLYDNAQLISLYSDAFIKFKNPLYQNVVEESLNFIAEEMTSKESAFFSALDADSVNKSGVLEEGAYYAWEKDELQELLGKDYSLFAAYYSINDYGHWEDGKYVLIKTQDESQFCKSNDLKPADFAEKLKQWKAILLKIRQKRNPPARDEKVITAWNALMIKAYVDAYKAFKNEEYLDKALANAEFLLKNQRSRKGFLFRNYMKGTSSINAYLEDYALLIEALLSLYSVTFTKRWADLGQELADTTLTYFYNAEKGLFRFNSSEDRPLFSQTYETDDNVISSSNSVMAKNLYTLAVLFEDQDYRKTAEKMLDSVSSLMFEQPSGHSNWLDVQLNFSEESYELVCTGKKALQNRLEFTNHYLPNLIFAGTPQKSKGQNLPILTDRGKGDKSLYYCCQHGSCQKPEDSKYPILNTLGVEV